MQHTPDTNPTVLADRAAEWDRQVAAYLADLTELTRRHGIVIMARSEPGTCNAAAGCDLMPVPLEQHPDHDADAAWHHFRDGGVWWQR